MNLAMCGPCGADHETKMYDIASGDGRYQFGHELLNEGVMDYATHVATSDLATNGSPDGSSRGFHSIEESVTAKEDHSATHFQPSNRVSNYQEKGYHPTAAHEGNLDGAVEHTFSVVDTESRCHDHQQNTRRSLASLM
ncbi:hypothetical protein EJ02DRAFT_47045 [Clathrospora elynae]|uniref:Uncharacterized protein n=1 Tax=Clathrospora elynae TaxID=706981 RepID=A0A6A5SDY1_9PLEO|nr:hypothetical protein EJ02DRAFT_47045 [Clathrospora elynae]